MSLDISLKDLILIIQYLVLVFQRRDLILKQIDLLHTFIRKDLLLSGQLLCHLVFLLELERQLIDAFLVCKDL